MKIVKASASSGFICGTTSSALLAPALLFPTLNGEKCFTSAKNCYVDHTGPEQAIHRRSRGGDHRDADAGSRGYGRSVVVSKVELIAAINIAHSAEGM
jgi:hypothetical protein